MRYLLDLLDLARAHSAAGAALAVWVGARLGGAAWEKWWLLPMTVAFLLSAAGNAFNDSYDAAIDAINRPHRPVPRGVISPKQARRVAYACALLALLLALHFGPFSTLGTIAGILLLFLYTLYFKRTALMGTGVMALLTGMALGYGGLLAGNVPAIILPAATLGLLFGGRELLKSIYDLPGDRVHAVLTFATRAGSQTTLRAATFCFVTAMASLAMWAVTRQGGWLTFTLTATMVGALITPLWHKPLDRQRVARVLRWSKGLGLVLLIGFSAL